jgi:hypothetical protein
VYTSAIHSSTDTSEIGRSIIAISTSSSLNGVTFSNCLHLSSYFSDIQSITINHFSWNCHDTDQISAIAHPHLVSIVLISELVLLVFDVIVLIRNAEPFGPYHSYITSFISSHSNCPDHFNIALSITSLGNQLYLAFSSTISNAGFIFGSAQFLAAI